MISVRRFFQPPHPPILPTFAWYDAADTSTITASSGVISAMADKSGQGHTLTKTGTGNILTGNDTINNLNVLTFPATTTTVGTSNPRLATANVTLAQPFTILLALKLKSGAVLTAAAGEAVGEPVAMGTWTNPAWFYYAGSVQTAGTPDSSAHLLDAIFNGASSTLKLDSSTISSANPSTGGWSAVPFILGANQTSAGPWPGYIGEVLVYSSALSSTDRTNAENYLKAKWGTP